MSDSLLWFIAGWVVGTCGTHLGLAWSRSARRKRLRRAMLLTRGPGSAWCVTNTPKIPVMPWHGGGLPRQDETRTKREEDHA